jgi:hypothetical protein
LNRKLRTQISPEPEVAGGSNLAGRCGRRRPATVRDLRGLAPKGAPQEFFEIFGKVEVITTVNQLAFKVMNWKVPNYFYPIGDDCPGALERDRTLGSPYFFPHEFSKLVQKWSFSNFPAAYFFPFDCFHAFLQLCMAKKYKLAKKKIFARASRSQGSVTRLSA